MAGRRTALLVPVPEAEQVVGPIRLALDPVAGLGVPAHVTVLFPFVPADRVTDGVLAGVADVAASFAAFDHALVRTAWFGEDVLWLAPDRADRFRALVEAAVAAFPQFPPYEGRFADVVPHLTLADRGPLEAMRAAEREVGPHLPIAAVAREVVLLAEAPTGRWETAASFPLRDA